MATLPPISRRPRLAKQSEVIWNGWRRGMDLLLEDIELNDESFRQGDELVLKGKGVLTQRPGTADYFQAGSGKVRNLQPYYPRTGNTQLIAVTDNGYVTKKSSASYSILPGASFASGVDVTSVMIYDKVYFSSIDYGLTKYDGTSLSRFTAIATPSSVTATKVSGTSGTFTWGWRVSAESSTGETLASSVVSLTGLPEEFDTSHYVTISWASVPNAVGYPIYGRDVGNETLLSRVPATSTSWVDDGSSIPSLFSFPPSADYSAGVKGKFIITLKEKLVIANIENNPSRITWSGGGPNIEKFHWSMGGGYVDINKDDGEEITGIREQEGKILVFKNRSTYQVNLTYNDTYGVVEPIVQKIPTSIGAVSFRSIIPVENDIAFIGRRPGGGVSLNFIGYEPNFTAVLRTSEISARVRPEFELVTASRSSEIWSIYYANKIWMFYPIGNTGMRCIAYDRERLAFLGPFNFPNIPACGAIYYDDNDQEKFLYGDSDDGFVTEISDGYTTDKGDAMTWTFRTKKEELKDPFILKNLIASFFHFRNVIGDFTVSIRIEKKDGTTAVAKSFTVTGAPSLSLAGWGSFAFGSKKYGSSTQASTTTSLATADVIRFINVQKVNVRSVDVTITGTGSRADILAMKLIMSAQPPFNVPSAWRVSS